MQRIGNLLWIKGNSVHWRVELLDPTGILEHVFELSPARRQPMATRSGSGLSSQSMLSATAWSRMPR